MTNIKKILISLFCSIQLLFSASSEQIENYLSISKSDSELIAIEQVFDSMRDDEDNSSQEINQIYSLYLEEHMSSNELEKLLELYSTPIMQRYVVEMDIGEIPSSEMNTFLTTLEENPLTTERSDIVEKILKHTVNEKQILSFYSSMTQRYQPKKSKQDNKNNKTKELSKQEKKFLNMMKESAKNSLLYGTQVLSIEEMNELNTALKSSIITKVTKVKGEAMIHVMDSFIKNMVAKPKTTPKESKESNLSKTKI